MKKSNDISITTKICSRCKEEKSLDDFFPRKEGKDGYRGTCKICDRSENRRRYEENIEHKREVKKNYYKNHPNRAELNKKKYIDSKKRSDENQTCINCGKHALTRYCQKCSKAKNAKKVKRCFETFKCVRCGSDLTVYGEDGIYKTCINCREKLNTWR